MADYKKMYLELFNTMTLAIDFLQAAQQQAEERYIACEEPDIHLVPDSDDLSESDAKKQGETPA